MSKWNLTVHHAGEVIGEFSLPNGTFLVGTDPACGIFLQVAGVAPMHAEIQLGGEDLLVEDLGSVGGTTVNGYAISGRVGVAFPARVQVGETVILLEAAAEPPSALQDAEHPSQDLEDEQHPLEQGETAGGRTETPPLLRLLFKARWAMPQSIWSTPCEGKLRGAGWGRFTRGLTLF